MKGSYLLVIKLNGEKNILVGKKGEIFFQDGLYVYVGSALNGILQRVKRHLNPQKKMHWHIDYFLQHAKIESVYYKQSNTRKECDIAGKLEKKLKSVPNFGCSDCNCRSHLFYGTYERVIDSIEKLEMNRLLIEANS
ncbi:MAG: GIY-YIG nuclease family protein [Candidatus Thermoplasmatota archaeon]|nr:GIY-YIG nuclease family protein [Candidatus Thermoplasmatota archaeon]